MKISPIQSATHMFIPPHVVAIKAAVIYATVANIHAIATTVAQMVNDVKTIVARNPQVLVLAPVNNKETI